MGGGRVVRDILLHSATRPDTSRLDPLPGFGGGVQGSVIFRTHDRWVWLGPGTDNQVLESQGADKDARWVTPIHADIGTIGEDDHFKHYGVQAEDTDGQSIANNTITTINLDTERWDTDPGLMHDNSTNNERLTCKTAGKYIAIAKIEWAAHATGDRVLYLYRDPATILAYSFLLPVDGTNGMPQQAVALVDLAVDDYLYMRAAQSSGGSLNITANSEFSPILSAQRIGP